MDPLDREITGLSSTAPRLLLTELSEQLRVAEGLPVRFESAGGVRSPQPGRAAEALDLRGADAAAKAARGRGMEPAGEQR